MAITLADSIDFDFAKFGRTRQDFALRALTFDIHTRRYLNDHPSATVVALAEGLQTSFWRLDAGISEGQFRWLTVDLPPIPDLRTRLLPKSPRMSVGAQSALDYSWTDRVDPSQGVFITAEGLLMYLQPEQGLGLIAECAKRFPGAQMLFDMPAASFAKLARRGHRTSRRYKFPPMPFAMSPSEAANLVNTVPGPGRPRPAGAAGPRPAAQRPDVDHLPDTCPQPAASDPGTTGIRLTPCPVAQRLPLPSSDGWGRRTARWCR